MKNKLSVAGKRSQLVQEKLVGYFYFSGWKYTKRDS
jgi:hypothetical protein